jgi:DNA-binding NarL/FixJ family response regulator
MAVTPQSRDAPAILIVDPEDDARARTVDVIRRAGYSTLQAKSGEDALEIIKRERPGAVVLEVCLPDICGYEVCRELREVFGESLGIVFVSALRTESFDRVGGLLLGADDYLAKPFASDELLARVRRLLPRAAPTASGVTSLLTPRERDVFQLLAEGLGQAAIAGRLFISPKTVATHLEHIFSKLGVHSRAQAVALVHQEELAHRGSFHSLAIAPIALAGGDWFWQWLNACGAALFA